MRDRGATRALTLGLLALFFAVLAPFAIWVGARSLRRIAGSHGSLTGRPSASAGLAAGAIGLAFAAAGILWWVIAG